MSDEHDRKYGLLYDFIRGRGALRGDDVGMTTRTKATVAEGIVSQKQLTSNAETFRYEYEPGNMTCYEVYVSAWQDGQALIAIWPGVPGESSCCVVQTDGYLSESYVAEKLGVGSDDALVLAEFLGYVLACDAPCAGPAKRIDPKPGVVFEERAIADFSDLPGGRPDGSILVEDRSGIVPSLCPRCNEGVPVVISSLGERSHRNVTHPMTGEKIPLTPCIDGQAEAVVINELERVPGVVIGIDLPKPVMVFPRQEPRPTFTSFVVRVPTLLTSLEEAIEILGDEARLLEPAFITGAGMRGIWAVPHPDAHPSDPVSVALSEEETAALSRWANEGDRDGGCSGWGPVFDDAMAAARSVRDGAESR